MCAEFKYKDIPLTDLKPMIRELCASGMTRKQAINAAAQLRVTMLAMRAVMSGVGMAPAPTDEPRG